MKTILKTLLLTIFCCQIHPVFAFFNFNPNKLRIVVLEDTLGASSLYKQMVGNFLAKRLKTLDSVRALSNSQKQYLVLSFTNRSLGNPDLGFADNFLSAMHGVLKDTIYYAIVYKNEIARKSNMEVLNFYQKNQVKIGKTGYLSIKPLLYKKFRELQLLDYVYQVGSKESNTLWTATSDRFDRLIDSVLIRAGVFLRDSKFATAVKFKKQLMLKDSQVDSLLSKASKMEYMITEYKQANPAGALDTKPYQNDQITKILDVKQAELFLSYKNQDLAIFSAKRDWERLIKVGITNGLDSTVTVRELYMYHLQRYVTIERYSINPTTDNKQLKKDAEEKLPPVLAKLNLAIKGSEELKTLKKGLAW